MDPEEVILIGMVAVVFAGVGILWMGIYNRRKIREMEHRERLAMIERGLMPPPERDPAAFEEQAGFAREPASRSSVRARSAGVMLIGLGLALITLITFVGNAPEVGIGIGGAIALVGAAFCVNAVLLSRTRMPHPDDIRPVISMRQTQRPEPPPGPPPTSSL